MEAYVTALDMKALAEFVEEGLAGLGILDDADEILMNVYDTDGPEGVKKAQKYYNNAIAFVNEVNENSDLELCFITDQEIIDWELDKPSA